LAPPKRTSLAKQDIAALADGVLAGNRRVLAQAITLIESTRSDHRAAASTLLERLMPSAGNSIGDQRRLHPR
jgi:LAO/AO transport system kinase